MQAHLVECDYVHFYTTRTQGDPNVSPDAQNITVQNGNLLQRSISHDAPSHSTTNQPPPPPPPRRMQDLQSNQSAASSNARVLCPQLSDPGPTAQCITRSKRHSDLTKQTASRKVVIAMYDYEPLENDDLKFKRGDVMIVLRQEHHWLFARHTKTRKVGFIPKNYFKLYAAFPEPEDISSENSTQMAFAITDNLTLNPDELRYNEGDLFTVFNNRLSWWYVKHLRTNRFGFVDKQKIWVLNEIKNDSSYLLSI